MSTLAKRKSNTNSRLTNVETTGLHDAMSRKNLGSFVYYRVYKNTSLDHIQIQSQVDLVHTLNFNTILLRAPKSSKWSLHVFENSPQGVKKFFADRVIGFLGVKRIRFTKLLVYCKMKQIQFLLCGKNIFSQSVFTNTEPGGPLP
jgi:hypothetical protein